MRDYEELVKAFEEQQKNASVSNSLQLLQTEIMLQMLSELYDVEWEIKRLD